MTDYFETQASKTDGIYNLSPLQAYAMCQQGAIVIDVREEYLNRYKIMTVPQLVFCPKSKLPALMASLPHDKLLIVADASGIHSPGAVRFLMQNGHTGHCANLSGGLVDWEHSGLPVTIDINERTPGQYLLQQAE